MSVDRGKADLAPGTPRSQFGTFRTARAALTMSVDGANWPPAWTGGHCLELDLFGHIESVIYLDSQISNGTLQFRMTEEKLNGA